MKKSTVLVVAVSTLAVLAPSAFAAIDVSTAAGEFTTDFTTAAAAVGGAMISAAFVAVVYKWIKATIFG
jgi:hypothetical protein